MNAGSDIYSLGVMLYEPLTSRTPFDQKELLAASLDEMRRIIREKEPLKPSTRLTRELLGGGEVGRVAPRAPSPDEIPSLGGVHAVTPPTSQPSTLNSQPLKELIHALRGDLDWLVMKCLGKDRTRRYETANGLAMDLQRHLNNEPVGARPPGTLYRFQKLVRRNKLIFAATAAILLLLLAGVVASTWQAARATNAEREQSRMRVAAEQAQANEAKQKAAAQQGLYDSLLEQARAARLAQRLGYRDRVFDPLEQAKALDVTQKNLADLRNEAVACLGNVVGRTPATFADFPTDIMSPGHFACLADSGKIAAFRSSDGTLLSRI